MMKSLYDLFDQLPNELIYEIMRYLTMTEMINWLNAYERPILRYEISRFVNLETGQHMFSHMTICSICRPKWILEIESTRKDISIDDSELIINHLIDQCWFNQYYRDFNDVSNDTDDDVSDDTDDTDDTDDNDDVIKPFRFRRHHHDDDHCLYRQGIPMGLIEDARRDTIEEMEQSDYPPRICPVCGGWNHRPHESGCWFTSWDLWRKYWENIHRDKLSQCLNQIKHVCIICHKFTDLTLCYDNFCRLCCHKHNHIHMCTCGSGETVDEECHQQLCYLCCDKTCNYHRHQYCCERTCDNLTSLQCRYSRCPNCCNRRCRCRSPKPLLFCKCGQFASQQLSTSDSVVYVVHVRNMDVDDVINSSYKV